MRRGSCPAPPRASAFGAAWQRKGPPLPYTGGPLNATMGEGEGKEPGMPRSLAHGDYRLMMAVESASRANSWYRVLIDHQSGQLSCDCPSWTFRHDARSPGVERSCTH